MTVQEAKEYLEYMLEMMADEPPTNLTDIRDIKEWEDEHSKVRNTLEISLSSLEEVEQYRALGTVEELKEALMKVSVYEQIKWERDIAISQLEEIGISLGQKMDDIKEAREKQKSRREWYQKGYQDGLNADKWISCEERLPELDEGMEYFKQSKEYLVTVQWWDEETNVDIGWYNQNGMWSNDSKNCKVIAWLPIALPQPYKKEGAE